MKIIVQEKISYQSEEAQPYIRQAAVSIREQAISMIRELPDEMKISGKAVNETIKGVFQEGDFTFALYVEKDNERPARKFFGISGIASFVPWSAGTYLYNNTKEGLLHFIANEYSVEQCSEDLLWCMQSLLKSTILDLLPRLESDLNDI